MNKALSILSATTETLLHRKGEEVLQGLLPAKHHHVVHLRLTPPQQRLYVGYLKVRAPVLDGLPAVALHAVLCASPTARRCLNTSLISPRLTHAPLAAKNSLLSSRARRPSRPAPCVPDQVCEDSKALFMDRLNLNMICDVPAAFISKLQLLAAGKAVQAPADAELAEPWRNADGEDLHTPRGHIGAEAADEDLMAPEAGDIGKRETLTSGRAAGGVNLEAGVCLCTASCNDIMYDVLMVLRCKVHLQLV